MSGKRARNLVMGLSELVSLPEACVRVNEMVDDPRFSAADMAQAISQDPALTARLLKVANSSFYRFPSKIETVSRAVTVIGTRELRFLVLATAATRAFDGLPVQLVDMAAFWRHSIHTAVIARALAAQCSVLHRERLFVAGLLHDIGHVVMYHRIPELVKVMFHRAHTAQLPLHEAEKDIFDVDHADVGAELMRQWRLPPSLTEVVACHHAPERAERFVLEAAIVHIANELAHLAERGLDPALAVEGVAPVAWEITGLDPDSLVPVLDEARGRFVEALLLFLPVVQEKSK